MNISLQEEHVFQGLQITYILAVDQNSNLINSYIIITQFCQGVSFQLQALGINSSMVFNKICVY